MIKSIKFLLFLVLIGCQFTLQSFTSFSESLPDLLEQVNEKHTIDKQAACLVIELGGGIYYEELQAIIPLQPELVHEEWQKRRNSIAQRIGQLYPAYKEATGWQNSARSVEELISDAQRAAPCFKQACQEIARKVHSEVNFGPENAYMIKSRESLQRKVTQDAQNMGISEAQAVAKIGDAIRGTIITDWPDHIPAIAEEIRKYVARLGGAVVFRNYWEEERDSGYVAVHAKLFLPIIGQSWREKKRFILAELQIHLKCIMDGSEQCVKERGHLLYEKCRTDYFDPLLISHASKLLYLTALNSCYCKQRKCESLLKEEIDRCNDYIPK